MIDSENKKIEALQGILLGFLSGNVSNLKNLVKNNCGQFFWTLLFKYEVLRKRRIDCGERDMASVEERQKYLLLQISSDLQKTEIHIDYANACLIAQYLLSKRHFDLFGEYLRKLVEVMREPCIKVRSQAMKSLTMIAEVDASILEQTNVQEKVKQAFLMQPICVRQITVNLIGKCVLKKASLIHLYYDLLLTEICDTGVSVRKRVIQIMRDICIGYPNFGKIPEMCMQLIKRANEDESVRKLIADAFVQLWFTPCADNDKVRGFGLIFHGRCKTSKFCRRPLAEK